MGPYCTWCGSEFGVEGWPRICGVCGRTTWRNPTPVGVVVVPVALSSEARGILTVRRAIEPGRGKLALPGGFLEVGEDWRTGTLRELEEETGITLDDPESLTLLSVESTPNTSQLLIFTRAPAIDISLVEASSPGQEVDDLVVVQEPVELAFSLHEAVLAVQFEEGLDQESGNDT